MKISTIRKLPRVNCAPNSSTRWPNTFSSGAIWSMLWLRTVCPPEYHSDSAAKIDQAPSVAMNGGRRNSMDGPAGSLPAAAAPPAASPSITPTGADQISDRPASVSSATVASAVTSTGITRIRVTSAPLNSPQASPAPRPISTARKSGAPPSTPSRAMIM